MPFCPLHQQTKVTPAAPGWYECPEEDCAVWTEAQVLKDDPQGNKQGPDPAFNERVLDHYDGPDIIYSRRKLKTALIETVGRQQWRKKPQAERDALYESAIDYVEGTIGWAIPCRGECGGHDD